MKKESDQDFLRRLQSIGDPRKIQTENIRRSDHNDFATTSELRERNFSGWRGNSLTNEMELWLHGRVRGTIKIIQNPDAMASAMQRLAEEVLAL